MICHPPPPFFFFFNDTATPEIYPLSLHDALPISRAAAVLILFLSTIELLGVFSDSTAMNSDRKSTRLNSSHQIISYAVFCLKKKKKLRNIRTCHNTINAL